MSSVGGVGSYTGRCIKEEARALVELRSIYVHKHRVQTDKNTSYLCKTHNGLIKILTEMLLLWHLNDEDELKALWLWAGHCFVVVNSQSTAWRGVRSQVGQVSTGRWTIWRGRVMTSGYGTQWLRSTAHRQKGLSETLSASLSCRECLAHRVPAPHEITRPSLWTRAPLSQPKNTPVKNQQHQSDWKQLHSPHVLKSKNTLP